MLAGTVDVINTMAIDLTARAELEDFAVRAPISLQGGIESEIGEGEGFCLGRDTFSGMDTIPETLLINKAWIALAVVDVRDVGIKTLLLAEGEIGLAEIIAVSAKGLAGEKIWMPANGDHGLVGTDHHRGKVLVILSTEDLGMQDDLMLVIDEGLGVVPLDDAVRTGHLGRLIIGEITLDLLEGFSSFGLVVLEEGIEALDLTGEAVFLTLAAFLLGRGSILAEVLSDLEFELFLELIPFMAEFMKSSAPFFGGIGRELETIEAEVSATE